MPNVYLSIKYTMIKKKKHNIHFNPLVKLRYILMVFYTVLTAFLNTFIDLFALKD